MRLFNLIGLMILVLASCGGSRTEDVPELPGENPLGKLTLSASQVPDRWLEVSVEGGVGPYTITVTDPAGLIAEQAEVESANGQAVFNYAPVDPVYGGGGLCVVSVEDASGTTEQTEAVVAIEAIKLKPATLYAIPLKHEAKVGEAVRVLVATGRTTLPFSYSITTITFDDDLIGDSLHDAFNIGTPGNGQWDADGVWSQISADDGFFFNDSFGEVRSDRFYNVEGRRAVRWYCSPNDRSTELEGAIGSLFSFEVSFSEPGLKQIGIHPDEISRNYTYYGGLDFISGPWSVLMADELGQLHFSMAGHVDNTILVTE